MITKLHLHDSFQLIVEVLYILSNPQFSYL